MPAHPKAILVTLLIASGSHPLPLGASETTNVASLIARIPLEFHAGAAFVRARVNDSQTLTFKLDTGFGVTTIHPEWVESLGLKRVGTLTISGIAGKEKADWLSGAAFDFGGAAYAPRRIAMIPSDARRPRHGQDGILGAGFFRRFVVELDPEQRTMTLHDPGRFRPAGPGEVLPIQFRRDTPIVEATIHLPGREPVPGRFELDTGCDGALCLGHDFVAKNRFEALPGRNHPGSRTGVGGSVQAQEARLPQFQIGAQTLAEVPANLFKEGSPVDGDLAGHIGLGLLRRFKIRLDYSRRELTLERLN